MALGSPTGPVSHDPVQQGLLKSNVVTQLLALDPFMLQDLFPLCQKLPVKRGVLEVIFRIRGRLRHDELNIPLRSSRLLSTLNLIKFLLTKITSHFPRET